MSLGPTFTPANQLTMTRMLLIPAFVILLMYGYRGWALVTFLTAGLTDLFDGLIARMSGEAVSKVTEFGSHSLFRDPDARTSACIQ